MKKPQICLLLMALVSASLLWTESLAARETEIGNMPPRNMDAADSSLTVPIDETVEVEPEVLPELLDFVEADYPAEALKKGIEGSVLLQLLINETGAVDSVDVLESLEPSLDAAALAAAASFVFSPARAQGEAVPVLLLFEYSFSIREQTRKIEEFVNFAGLLKEKGTRTPIAYATVVVSWPETPSAETLDLPWASYLDRIGGFEGQYLEESSLVALSDSLGRFVFKSLPPGTFTVKFPNAGYEMMSEEETLAAEERIDATYFLPRSSYDEYEIVVYGKTEQKEVTRRRLTVTEVERIPGFGGDAIKAIQALPGVARPHFISGEVIVRGSNTEDTRYYLDGIEIPMLFHYGGVKSTYNSRMLAAIDLYPGGFNTRYGNSVGGVVEITGRPGKTDRLHGTIDLNVLDSSLHFEGPLAKNLSFSVAGRRSYVGEIADIVLSDIDNFDMAVVPYYWDYVARLDYTPNKKHRLFFTLFSAKDRMELIYSDHTADKSSSEVNAATDAISMDSYFDRLIFGHDWRPHPNWENELRFALGHDEYRGHVFGHFDYVFKSTNYTLRDEVTFKHSDRLHYRLGVDLVNYPLDYSIRSFKSSGSDVDKTFSDYGYYANVELRPNTNLLAILGCRHDYFEELKEGTTTYRLTTRYKLNEKHTLTGAAGSYSQTPVPRGQAVDPVYGNPDLPPTLARHFTVGDEWRLSDLVNMKVEGYFNTQEQIPAGTDSLDLNFLPDMDARMYGVELMLRHEQSGRFFGWLSYSLTRSERRSPRKPDNSILGAWDPDKWYISEYDQTHHFEAIGSWNFGSTWSAGARARYVTGNPDTPVLSYSSNQYWYDSDEGEYKPLYGEYRSDRMDPFFQLDFRIDKKYVFKNWILSTYLDVQNANYFFYNSPELYYYNFDNSERKTIGGIILPTLGFKAEF